MEAGYLSRAPKLSSTVADTEALQCPRAQALSLECSLKAEENGAARTAGFEATPPPQYHLILSPHHLGLAARCYQCYKRQNKPVFGKLCSLVNSAS